MSGIYYNELYVGNKLAEKCMTGLTIKYIDYTVGGESKVIHLFFKSKSVMTIIVLVCSTLVQNALIL